MYIGIYTRSFYAVSGCNALNYQEEEWIHHAAAGVIAGTFLNWLARERRQGLPDSQASDACGAEKGPCIGPVDQLNPQPNADVYWHEPMHPLRPQRIATPHPHMSGQTQVTAYT
jgi:hypothetical protein